MSVQTLNKIMGTIFILLLLTLSIDKFGIPWASYNKDLDKGINISDPTKNKKNIITQEVGLTGKSTQLFSYGNNEDCYKKSLREYNNIQYSVRNGSLQLQEAAKKLEKIHKSNPKCPLVVTYLGTVYFLLENYENAIDMFEYLLLIQPNRARAYVALGIIHDHLYEFGSGLTYYQKAYEIDKEDVLAYYYLGWTYYHLTDYETALKYLKSFEKEGNIIDQKQKDHVQRMITSIHAIQTKSF